MIFFSPPRLSPCSRLPQQQLHGDQRLEDTQHGKEQVVCVHGQERGGQTEVAGRHPEGAGAERE